MVSDGHEGIRAALQRAFPQAAWQRCRIHFIRNIMNKSSHKDRIVLINDIRAAFKLTDRSLALKAAKVRFANVSLSKAKVIVDTDVENPNAFALEVNKLEYELDLGDVQLAVFNESEVGSIGPEQVGRLTLTGHISASDGLINVLMDGIATLPLVSVSGSVGTAYGTLEFPE